MSNDADRVADEAKKVAKSKRLQQECKKCSISDMNWLPDWKDVTNYDIPPEHYERWAWEFLRRNAAFQSECADKFKWRDEERQYKLDFKNRWGLDEFKHFQTPFQPACRPIKKLEDEAFHEAPRKQSPIWTPTKKVRLIDSTTGPTAHKKLRELNLQSGQVAVVYDLNFAKLDGRFLDAQLEEARLLLSPPLARLIKKSGNEPYAETDRTALKNPLRVVDALLAGNQPSQLEIANQLMEDGDLHEKANREGMSAYEVSKPVGKLLAAAYELIYERGYLRLLANALAKRSKE